MWAKCIKILLSSVLTLLLVSVSIFFLATLIPGDSASFLLSEDVNTEEVEIYRESKGYNENLFIRYLKFIKNFFSLNWGKSNAGWDIKSTIIKKASLTVEISLMALLLALILSLPLSLLSQRDGNIYPSLLTAFSSIFLSLPSFLIAFLLIFLFALLLPLFPVAGFVPLSSGFFSHIRFLFLPALTLSLLEDGLFLRLFNEALKEEKKKDYVLTARAKGIRDKKIPIKTILKPSMPVLLTLIAEVFTSTIGGVAVIESVFALPGLGSLMVSAALSRDTNVSSILTLLFSIAVIIIFTLSELLSLYLDKRGGEDEKN